MIGSATPVDDNPQSSRTTVGDLESPALVEQTGRLVLPSSALFQWASAFVPTAVCLALVVVFGVRITLVVGFSMEPTIENHDGLLVDRVVYALGSPHTGDIVSLYYPLDPERVFIKRIVAEGGDFVRIVGGLVYVNDDPLRDDYVESAFRSYDNLALERVPDDCYFVLGDHRNSSSDSRDWGLVPRKNIIGKVRLRWWPLHHLTIF